MTDPKTAELVPAYRFQGPNQSVHIADDQASIEDGGGKVLLSGPAEVRLVLLPRPRVQILVSSQNLSFSILNKPAVLKLLNHGRQVEGFPAKTNVSTSTGTHVAWHPRSEPILGVGNDNTGMRRVVFHLFNFKEILGTTRSVEQRDHSSHAIEHANLESSNWSVELRSLAETKENIEKLNNEGGYGLTHVASLKKNDGANFSGKHASEMLDALRFFFSFAKGAWCNPVCPVGFNKSGKTVWQSWSSPRDSWCSPLSWFDPHTSTQIEQLFPGFLRRWQDMDWRAALHEVIYWYMNANDSSRGIDAGIVLTQTAIERLSFEYSVKERKLVETEGFKGLRASDKFRLLFSSLDIPVGISSNSPELGKLAKQFKWLDAPHSITEVRNSLVHPEHKRRGQFNSALYETWNLGLWYLELALLRLCGFSGTYSNRLIPGRWVGQVEDVPWKP